MIFVVLICAASICTPHHATAFGADGWGNAFIVENNQRIDFHVSSVWISGWAMGEEIFCSNFEGN